MATTDAEGWHYVGDGTTGLGTTFSGGWANGDTDRNLAFRIRQAGIVDIQGFVLNTSVPTAASVDIFTLPEGYRPADDTDQGTAHIRTDVTADGFITAPVYVGADGTVKIIGADDDPAFSSAGASGAYAGVVYAARIFGQFFLDPASAP